MNGHILAAAELIGTLCPFLSYPDYTSSESDRFLNELGFNLARGSECVASKH
jgi:hypothetical protein